MTKEEELAVAIADMRFRGMHPEWIKWFAFYKDGEFLRSDHSLFINQDTIIRYYCYPPTEAHKNDMRRYGYEP